MAQEEITCTQVCGENRRLTRLENTESRRDKVARKAGGQWPRSTNSQRILQTC
jgi:hypothetical protein